MILTGEDGNTQRKTCPSVILFTNPTRNGLGSNMDRPENGLMEDLSSSHNLSWI